MLAIVGRCIEIILGVFFLVSAVLKATDVDAFVLQISLYKVLTDPALVRLAAFGTLAIESALGAAFVGGWRGKGISFAVGCGLTTVFTGLIFYAWRYHGLEDCGCFGKYVSMGPLASIIKNFVLIAVLGGAWYATSKSPLPAAHPLNNKVLRVGAATVGVTLCAVFAVVSGFLSTPEGSDAIASEAVDEDAPFAQFQFEVEGQEFRLGEGEHLVAFLSATCGHCQASVPGLNELVMTDGLPMFVALMQSDSPEALEEFQMLTEPLFPLQTIPDLLFAEMLEFVPPPRLFHVHDGREIRSWVWEDEPPSAEEVASGLREVVGSN